jgi:hypothetical protein
MWGGRNKPLTAPTEQTQPFVAGSRRKIFLAGVAIVLAALAADPNSFSGPFMLDDPPSPPQSARQGAGFTRPSVEYVG